MLSTVTALLEGNEGILRHYQEAKRLWNQIWENPQSETVEGLAELIQFNQLTFEQSCGGRYLGQEVMVLSGFMMLYDDGFNEKAELLKEAFNQSHVSFEVNGTVERFAKFSYLSE